MIRATAARMAAWACRICSSPGDAWRGQKKPRRPSFLRRGTMCTCKWGTLWLTRLLMATKEPSACMPSSTARATSWTFAKNAPIKWEGRSARVPQCCLGTSNACPRNSGRMSRKATEIESSNTTWLASSPAAIWQNLQTSACALRAAPPRPRIQCQRVSQQPSAWTSLHR